MRFYQSREFHISSSGSYFDISQILPFTGISSVAKNRGPASFLIVTGDIGEGQRYSYCLTCLPGLMAMAMQMA